MNASDFLYEKYGIAVTEHNKLPVAIKPMDLLKYMEEYAALRQQHVIGSVCDGCGSKFDAMDISVGVCYCCQKEIKQTDL